MDRRGLPGQVQDNSGSAIQALVTYSLMVLIIPISSYFISKSLLFEGFLGYDSSASYFYAAIVAIVAVHIVLIMFVVKAFKEDAKYDVKQD